jgi:arginine/lysine/ornithine decarboxylase
MVGDQNRAPVLDALAAYHAAGRYGFTPPGHRGTHGADPRALQVLGADVYRNDVLSTAGLDDRKASAGIVVEAQELMADAVGAAHAFFSTCGSSLSVKSAVLAVAGRHGRILVSRDAHKSVISGLVLSGLQPTWVRPQWDAQRHLAHPPSPEDVERAFGDNDVAGLLITSPTPYGTCADLAAIAEICHAHDKPLIVDEAWGAHLPFHEDLPTWAMDAGADLCVVSIHKAGGGLEQSSVFHVQGERIDLAHLQQCADMLATTSPNVLLYAAMDGWRRQMAQHGHDLLDAALQRAASLREELAALDGITVMHDELLGEQASHDLDELQLVLDLSALKISGYTAADWLRNEHALDMGTSDHRRIGVQLSYGDDPAALDRLTTALTALVKTADTLPRATPMYLPSPDDLEMETVVLPRDAFFGDVEDVPIERAAGRVCAEQITPYPPGIPAVLPGERINAGVLDYLRTGLDAGMEIPDAADNSLSTIRVLR